MTVPRVSMPLATLDVPMPIMHLPSRANPATEMWVADGEVLQIEQPEPKNGGILVLGISDGSGLGASASRLACMTAPSAPEDANEVYASGGVGLPPGEYSRYVPPGEDVYAVARQSSLSQGGIVVHVYWLQESQ